MPIEPSSRTVGAAPCVQPRDEVLEQLEPHAATCRARTRSRRAGAGRARRRLGRGVALADAVLEDQAAVELGELAPARRASACARRRRSSSRRPARRPRASARRSPGRRAPGPATSAASSTRSPPRATREQVVERERVSPVSVTVMGDSLAHVSARLTVVGSINLDLVARTERLPRPGETVTGATFAEIPGGKGANQAVAAARLGAEVTLIGCVGDDEFATPGARRAARRRRRPRPAEDGGRADGRRADHRRRDRRERDRRRTRREQRAAPGGRRPSRLRRRPLPARDPARDGRARREDRAGRLLPERGACARPGSRRRRDDREPLRARGARRTATASIAVTLGAEGAILLEDGEEVARAAPPPVDGRRRHRGRRRVHRLPRRLAARGPRRATRRSAAPASPARSPRRASARRRRCPTAEEVDALL